MRHDTRYWAATATPNTKISYEDRETSTLSVTHGLAAPIRERSKASFRSTIQYLRDLALADPGLKVVRRTSCV